jgi:hypothetical protein
MPRRKLLSPRLPRPGKRGPVTLHEKEAVASIVMDHPGPLSEIEAQALAVAFRRSPDTIKGLIDDARATFAAKAGRYVEIHAQATEDALKTGELDTALKGSQWAIERIAQDGSRVVDKTTDQTGGTKIILGISMGGISPRITEGSS